MARPETGGSSQRAVVVGRIVFIWAALVVGRLVQLQVVEHDDWTRAARAQQQHLVPLPSDRGEILDRTGQALAVSIRTQTAAVNPQKVSDPDFFAGNVAPVLGRNAVELAGEIRALQIRKQVKLEAKKNGKPVPSQGAKEPSLDQLILKRHLSPTEREGIAALRSGAFRTIEILRDQKRIYPNDRLAIHVVGGLDEDGAGNFGIEARLNTELRGRPGKVRVLSDSRQDTYYSWVVDPGQQGANVTLTLHRLIQHSAEVELVKAMAASGAWSGSVVVMDPQNGEVLAMANAPDFSREHAVKNENDLRLRTNIAVQAPCEPGSVMKMITVTMGLETRKFTPETPIYCENGAFPRPGRKPIHDVHHYGVLDVAGVLIKSSNIGVTKISLALGPDKLAEYLGKFGMGRKTNVGLPGESRGMLRPREQWDPASHEYMSFGHEISATAIQLARAVSVIANGGLLVQPHLVLRKERPSAQGRESVVLPLEYADPVRSITPEIAFIVRRIMERVVVEGTGKAAKIPGYTAGGKTGSAEIFDPKLKRWINRHNSSFIGFAPVTNPRIVVVVTLNGSVKLGGVSAAPVFSKVAETALRVLQVPKDLPDETPAENPPKGEEKEDKNEPTLLAEARAEHGSQEPEEEVTELGRDVVGPRVPDFRGKPAPAVLRTALALGLPVRVSGQGLAREQKPAPGRILPAGAAVEVSCRR